jgi:hypothetical protein
MLNTDLLMWLVCPKQSQSEVINNMLKSLRTSHTTHQNNIIIMHCSYSSWLLVKHKNISELCNIFVGGTRIPCRASKEYNKWQVNLLLTQGCANKHYKYTYLHILFTRFNYQTLRVNFLLSKSYVCASATNLHIHKGSFASG